MKHRLFDPSGSCRKSNGTIFEHAQPWQMNACLNFMHDMSHGYVEGYRKAADRLVEIVAKTQCEQDYLVYPIVFLYRHHIELRIKQLLELLYEVGERKTPPTRGHDLRQLWSECRPALKSFVGGGEKEGFRAVDRLVADFSSVDPMSDAFRYPRHRDGTKSVSKVRHMNLAVLREKMDIILEWLECCAFALEAQLEAMSEEMG